MWVFVILFLNGAYNLRTLFFEFFLQINIYLKCQSHEVTGYIHFLYDADVGNSRIEEQQQHQNFPDESTIESTASPRISKNLVVEDDLKSSYALDSPVC